ncbi:MAG: ATP-dependent zinc metalloprotease FtsH [Saprospirales bacterium]|nr:ATP-dependent zinc metalloprotease FtsH [Saprospirales bacterium]
MGNNDPETPQKPKIPGTPLQGWWWVYILVGILLISQWFMWGSKSTQETTWLDFQNTMLARQDVESIVIVNQDKAEIYIKPDRLGQGIYQEIPSGKAGPHYYMNIGSGEHFEDKLEEFTTAKDLDPIPIKYEKRSNWWGEIISWIIPLLIIVAIWIYILRRVGRGNAGGSGFNPFDFGKSGAQVFDDTNISKVTFEDVAGLEEAKVEVMEVVDFLKNPGTYTSLGAKIPKGVILVGPPGAGKTLMARAVAGEAKVPFFSISGSEFVEMFVGVGASRVRDLFRKAKEKAPSIIFIDEIDAIGRSRSKAFSMQSNDERESTLNQLLTEMDGFGTNAGVIVMAATNRADMLDRALLRPGRFDRHIYLELPNLEERKAIFKVHMRPLKLANSIDIHTLGGQTPGFSGADIANICNEAALIAARRKKSAIEMEDFTEAIDRIIAGLEKKTKIISDSEKRIVAYHESGHATVSWFLQHTDTLMKVSIVPRGKSLGAAWYLPQEHQILTRKQFLDRLCAALGGRAAEDIIFDEVSSGALDDLEKVTKQAYTMVAFYGLDSEMGNISYYDSTGEYEQSLQKPYSEATAQLIDKAVRQLIESSYQRTKEVLHAHREELEELAQLLLKKEVVGKEELETIFGPRPDPTLYPKVPKNEKN